MFKFWNATSTFINNHPRFRDNFIELYMVYLTEVTREKPEREKKSRTKWDEYRKDFEMYDEFNKKRRPR